MPRLSRLLCHPGVTEKVAAKQSYAAPFRISLNPRRTRVRERVAAAINPLSRNRDGSPATTALCPVPGLPQGKGVLMQDRIRVWERGTTGTVGLVRADIALIALLTLAACAPAPAIPVNPVLQADIDPASSQSRAFFAAFPDRLLGAAAAACNGAGQRPETPDAGTVRCLTLPTPDIAAALILSYDGTVSDLPLYIVSFATTASGQGYVVTADSYVTVPQTDGTIRTIRTIDPVVTTGMMELLVAAGGSPVTSDAI